jgi:hypothetical protein
MAQAPKPQAFGAPQQQQGSPFGAVRFFFLSPVFSCFLLFFSYYFFHLFSRNAEVSKQEDSALVFFL